MGFKRIAITPPYLYSGEAENIIKALSSGFSRVHIRKPESSAEDVARLISGIPSDLRQRLSIHEHFELAEFLGIGGIHLNRRNSAAPKNWNGVLSCSTHSPEEARESLKKDYDYIFLSPFFPSKSKPGYNPRYSLQQLSEVASPRVIALGGIVTSDCMRIEELGFGGAAMLGDAWSRRMNLNHFRLQFITHPRPDMSVADEARMALEGGCKWIQLRHKDAPRATLLEEGKAISTLCRKFNATFIIDDHVNLVRELGADGVHLGKKDMPVAQARRILGPSYIIGATANTFEDIEAASIAGADYIGAGPFRFTTTKKNLAPTLGCEGYLEIIDRRTNCKNLQLCHCLPIVAIGGITADDLTDILNTGVDGVAVSGAILKAPDPVEATRKIIEKINNLIF